MSIESYFFLKIYLLKNLLLLFCVLCIYKYACVTHSFVVNKILELRSQLIHRLKCILPMGRLAFLYPNWTLLPFKGVIYNSSIYIGFCYISFIISNNTVTIFICK